MEFNVNLLVDLLIVAIIAEIISIQTVQMLKGYLSSPKWIPMLSLPICLGVGQALTRYFTTAGWEYGLMVGFFAWVGADALYKALNKGLKLAGWSEMNATTTDSNLTE
jgi:hypothetical protein